MPFGIHSATRQSPGAGVSQVELRHRWQRGERAIRITIEDRIGPLDPGVLQPPHVERVVEGGMKEQPAQAAASQRVYRFSVEIEDSKGTGRIHRQPEWDFGHEMLAVGSATSTRAGTRC